jgi:hypothetical protein
MGASNNMDKGMNIDASNIMDISISRVTINSKDTTNSREASNEFFLNIGLKILNEYMGEESQRQSIQFVI